MGLEVWTLTRQKKKLRTPGICPETEADKVKVAAPIWCSLQRTLTAHERKTWQTMLTMFPYIWILGSIITSALATSPHQIFNYTWVILNGAGDVVSATPPPLHEFPGPIVNFCSSGKEAPPCVQRENPSLP